MHGLPKNEVWAAQTLSNYSDDELAQLKQFIVESYYNAFIRARVGDKEIIGQYLKATGCADGKTRNWEIGAWNDFYMERDGIQVFEKLSDDTYELIIDLSGWELERMWIENCH